MMDAVTRSIFPSASATPATSRPNTTGRARSDAPMGYSE